MKPLYNPKRLGSRYLFTIILLVSWLTSGLQATDVNEDFDIQLILEEQTSTVLINILPEPDHKISGFSEKTPFLTLKSADVTFTGNGEIFLETAITRENPARIPLTYSPPGKKLVINLEVDYVACSISNGTCDFPKKTQLTFNLQAEKASVSGSLIRTIILGGLFLLALIAVLLYIKFRRDILFTGIILLLCYGMLFYTFTEPTFGGRTQAALSYDIAATLCLSCIGLETEKEVLAVDPAQTAAYTRLQQPVLITLFSAPWCGSCETAKTYLAELCRLTPTLTYQVIDISEEQGKQQFDQYATVFDFRTPLPLPAVIVSGNNQDIIYGAAHLDKNLARMIFGNAE